MYRGKGDAWWRKGFRIFRFKRHSPYANYQRPSVQASWKLRATSSPSSVNHALSSLPTPTEVLPSFQGPAQRQCPLKIPPCHNYILNGKRTQDAWDMMGNHPRSHLHSYPIKP